MAPVTPASSAQPENDFHIYITNTSIKQDCLLLLQNYDLPKGKKKTVAYGEEEGVEAECECARINPYSCTFLLVLKLTNSEPPPVER